MKARAVTMNIEIFFILFASLSGVQALADLNVHGDSLCESSVTRSDSSTDQLISFLEHQMSSGYWATSSQLELIRQFVSGEATLLNESLGQGVEGELRKQTVIRLLAQVADRSAVESWLMERMRELEEQSESRDQVEEETRATDRAINFVLFPGGDFQLPAKMIKAHLAFPMPVRVPYDFEVMDVPVTEKVWLEVMREAPPRDPTRIAGEYETIELDGRRFRIAIDIPVSNVTLFAAMEFANRLSQLHGLPAAYSFIGAQRGTAESGDLVFDQAVLNGQEFGDVSGYRIPALYEWMLMALPIFQDVQSLMSQQPAARLEEWGWFLRQAQQMLRPVRGKLPVEFPHGNLYDVVGLVSEWTHSWGASVPIGSGGSVDLRGHSVANLALNPVNQSRADSSKLVISAHDRRFSVGFRLVRTVGKREEPH